MCEGHKFSDKTSNRVKRSHQAIHRLRTHSHISPLQYSVHVQLLVNTLINSGCREPFENHLRTSNVCLVC